VPSPVLADFVDRDDPRVLELRGGAGLGVEAGNLVLVRQFPRAQQLEGHDAPELALSREVHNSHPAPGDLADDFVITNDAGRLGRCRGRGLLLRNVGDSGLGGAFSRHRSTAGRNGESLMTR
jgi:hypothetical protein